jgi:hypothetical protein
LELDLQEPQELMTYPTSNSDLDLEQKKLNLSIEINRTQIYRS